jgi:transposase
MDTHQNKDTFSIPDELWAKIEPLLPAPKPPKRPDRPGRKREEI